jgi:hypothetical protein
MPSILHPHKGLRGIKLRRQIANSVGVFRLELLDEFFELTLFSVDLLLKQVGTVLQVATDVTH